ncbi:aminoacyl-tRNA hydrolase [Calidifontibacter indicus]|uniref:aminoacyl-tRNA hydrolase n=1 Tax=Calidifontibacter indicus TaxID=419650 RepID=UPI000E271B24|nr:aminoacyl-tRNA hydrolase [Calidifontibacter indicus]
MPVEPWLIVGLGNPGPGYAGNRHNVGVMVVEEIARRAGSTLKAHKAQALAASVRLPQPSGAPGGPAAIIARPTTYMNVSGGPVKSLMNFFKVPLDKLVVVHDELDIDFADVRLKRGGGEGGHNGLRSITSSVGSKDYLRVRVGIGRPPGRMDAADFVLKDFNSTEKKDLPFLVDDAADAVQTLVDLGLTDAQNKVHAR